MRVASPLANPHGSVRLAGCLPSPDPRHFMNKHHDIQGEVITDRKSKADLYGDSDQYRCDWRDPRSKQEAHHSCQCVADRIDNSIAIITDRNGAGAIALNYKRAVLEDLPCCFNQDGQAQPSPNGKML